MAVRGLHATACTLSDNGTLEESQRQVLRAIRCARGVRAGLHRRINCQGCIGEGCNPPLPGGSDPPSATATPAPRAWLALPGHVESGQTTAYFFPWQEGGIQTPVADHHDDGPTHAVDLGAGVCSPCPQVTYYDTSGAVTATVIRFDQSCADGRGGGEKIHLELRSHNPPGVVQAVATYLHMEGALPTGTVVTDGSVLGRIAANPYHVNTPTVCWDGAHLHQGIGYEAPGATIIHHTGASGSGANCQGKASSAPYGYNEQGHADVPCYEVRW